MKVVKSMEVRSNFKSFCEQAYNGETIAISRKRNENVILLSEREYNDLLKAKQNAEYLSMLNNSIKEIENGGITIKTIDELENYE